MKIMNDKWRELLEFDRGYGVTLCGVDEAGRGPLAGPVFAACAVLRPGAEIPHLNDSKKLTEARREEIFRLLTQGGVAWYGVGSATPEEIDKINILQATFLAMNRAYAALLTSGIPEEARPRLALVDGNRDPGLPLAVETVVKGDGKSAAVAAASVLAKVSRDHYMEELDREYPQYQFAKHKGYPTKLHYELLERYGISPVHRRSFLKKLTGEK
jgi:ribonuclease HII